MFTDPDILKREFIYTVFQSRKNTTPIERRGTIQSFIDEVFDPRRLRNSKENCPLLQCTRYKPGATRSNEGIESFTALVGDYDEAEVPMKQAADHFRSIGIFSIFYQSFSATTKGEKWRVIVPTTQEMDAPTMKVSLARLNRVLSGVKAALSPESFVPAQAYYYGFNKELAEQGDVAEFSEAVPGALLDVGSTFFLATTPLFPVFTKAEILAGRKLFPDEAEDLIRGEVEIKGGKLGTGTGRTGHLLQYLKSYKQQNDVDLPALVVEANRVASTYFLDHHTMRIQALADWVDQKIDYSPRSRTAREAFENDPEETDELLRKVLGTGTKPKASDWKALRVVPQESGKPVEYTIDGFIPAGLSMIAAPWGAGKTSNLLPLAMVVAGMFRVTGITAEIRRKVVILSEDTDQVERILASLKRSEGWVSGESLEDWFYILPAVKHEPRALHKALVAIREELTYQDTKGFYVRPLVLLDTIPANIEVENENDNATVSRIAAAIKTSNTPTWGIGHTPKALVRADVSDMTFRGAGAWEADSMATLFLFYDEVIDRRVLALRKKRFGERYSEIHFGHGGFSEILEVPWAGEAQEVKFIHGEPEIGSAQDRKEARQEATTERREEAKEDRRLGKISEVLDLITRASAAGRILTRNMVVEELGSRKSVLEIIRGLMDAEQIQSVEIPDDLRPFGITVGTETLLPITLVSETFFSRVRQLGSSGRVQEPEEDTDL